MFDARFVKERNSYLLPNHPNFKKESCILRRSNSCMVYEKKQSNQVNNRIILKRQLSFDLEETTEYVPIKLKPEHKKMGDLLCEFGGN